jgi:type VI secretion system protein ImpM
MLSTKLSSQKTVGYFGKLPDHADFVKFNAARQELLLIDKWLQDGISIAKSKLKNDWKEVYENTPVFNFIYPYTGTKNLTLGTLYPSHDKSGRNFPFLIFDLIGRSYYQSQPAHILLMNFHRKLNSFDDYFDGKQDSGSLSNLNNVNLNNVIDSTIKNDFNKFLNEKTMEKFWEDTLGSIEDLQKYSILNNLYQNLAHLKSSSSIIISFGIKITFQKVQNNFEFYLGFFLQLILTIINKQFLIPSIFWTKNTNSSNIIYIFFNRPTPFNFLDLLYVNENSDRVLIANKYETEEKLFESIASNLKLLLDKNDLKLLQFLQSI